MKQGFSRKERKQNDEIAKIMKGLKPSIRKIPKIIKTCANCRHFEIIEEGYEIARIEDLKFMVSTCRILKWKVKEHYLFNVPEVLTLKKPKECSLWEPIIRIKD
ncbi:MAG: hypothetical protein AB1546_14125 [bacterium]